MQMAAAIPPEIDHSPQRPRIRGAINRSSGEHGLRFEIAGRSSGDIPTMLARSDRRRKRIKLARPMGGAGVRQTSKTAAIMPALRDRQAVKPGVPSNGSDVEYNRSCVVEPLRPI